MGLEAQARVALRTKLIIAIGSAPLVICFLGILSYQWTLREEEDQQWVAHTHSVLEALGALLTDTTSLQVVKRDYALTGDESYRSIYGTTLARVQNDINQVSDLTSDNPRQQESSKQFRILMAAKLSTLPSLKEIGDFRTANRQLLSAEQAFQEIRTLIVGMDGEERRLLAERLQAAAAGSARMKTAIVLGNILAILFLAGGAFTIHQEMVRRWKAEKELRASEERFRLMASSVKEYAIFMLDTEGKVASWNVGAERIKGYRAEEIVGRHFSRFYPPEDANQDKPENQLKIAAENGQIEDEGWRLRKDGSRLWANVVITAIRDQSGTLLGFCKVTRDMTERRQIQEAIQRKNAQLETSNRELDAFSYSVAHDLRAPLRAIDGFSLALLEDYQDHIPPQGKLYLERVRSGALRMAQLIDDLLKLARISRQQVERSQVDLTRLAEEIAVQLRDSSPDRQVRFLAAPGISVDGDRNLLRIVLENLLGNAWKFTSKKAEARVELGMKNGDGARVIYVRDNGAGFDMQYADKLFGVFQRLHRENEFSGTGVGLVTVQRIIHRHGGKIWAEAAPDEGATFYFVL